MFWHVIPLERSIGRDPVIYEDVLGETQPYTFVRIPWGKKNQIGLVWKEAENKTYDEVKPIWETLFVGGGVWGLQGDLIVELARKYARPIHEIAQAFFTKKLLEMIQKYPIQLHPQNKNTQPREQSIVFFEPKDIEKLTQQLIEKYPLERILFVFPDKKSMERAKLGKQIKMHTKLRESKRGFLGFFWSERCVAVDRSWMLLPAYFYDTIVFIDDGRKGDFRKQNITLRYTDILSFYRKQKNIIMLSHIPLAIHFSKQIV